MFEPSRGRVFACVIGAVLAYLLYVPIPERLGDRPKVVVVDIVARLLYFYPAKLLSVLGPRWQLFWTRSSLQTLIGVTNPIFKSDPDMTIENTIFAGVPVRVYVPNKRESDGAVIFIHGGGFVLLSVDAYDGVTRELARKTGMITVSIEYRLAPEHRFPAAIEDVENATVHFLTEAAAQYGVDPTKVAVAGDSAGGNLATVIAQRLRHKKYLPPLKAQALIYPVLQFSDFLSPSYQMYKTYDKTSFMDPLSIARWLSAYIGVEVSERLEDILANRHASAHPSLPELRHDNLPVDWHNSSHYVAPVGVTIDYELKAKLAPFLNNPDFAPLMQPDLSDMPTTFISTCEYDVLRDEGYLYAQRLKNQGGKVTYRHYPDGFHTIINFHSELEVGKRALNDVVGFLKEHLM